MHANHAIETQRLTLRIGSVPIVDEVSLSVLEGEFLVVIGPNGAGKTTLLNLLSGVARATSGKIAFRGQDVTNAPSYRRARLGMGRTFQTSSIFTNLPVLENVRLAAQAHLGGSDQAWRLTSGDREAVARAQAALEEVGLAARANAIAGALSHGEKRKLDLAILVATDASVVLLDEPTAGMAVEDIPDIVNLLRRMHRERGSTVVMVEHRLDLIQGLADRMAVMHHGAMLAIDTPARVIANDVVQSAYLGDPL
ncbi:MAG TPA: ABC transporter ATP-binding protein [Candidatus Aquilonibacter sp.]